MPSESPLVPSFRELRFPDAEAELDAIAGAIEERLEPPWERDRETEEGPHLRGRYRVFRRSARDQDPGLSVFVAALEGDVYVANIVPNEVGELSRDQYNSAISEFFSAFAEPAAHGIGIPCHLSSDTIDVASRLSEPAHKALLAFSRTANRSTGSSHPMDRERWYDFLALAVDTADTFSSSLLQDWLIEDGWSEEIAWDLVLEFEFALGLLKHVRGG